MSYSVAMVKRAYGEPVPTPYWGSPKVPYSHTVGTAPRGISSADGLNWGLQGALWKKMEALGRKPADGSLYGYYKENPDELSSNSLIPQFRQKNPKRWADITAARSDLQDAGGRGWFNWKNRIKGSMNPSLMVDAILTTRKAEDRISMLNALKRDRSDSARAAVSRLERQAPQLFNKDMRSKFWLPDPGTRTGGGTFDLLNGVSPEGIPGNPLYNRSTMAKLTQGQNKTTLSNAQSAKDWASNDWHWPKSTVNSVNPYPYATNAMGGSN